MRARKREPGGLDVQGLGAALGRIQPRAMPADTADGPERKPERRPDWPDWTTDALSWSLNRCRGL